MKISTVLLACAGFAMGTTDLVVRGRKVYKESPKAKLIRDLIVQGMPAWRGNYWDTKPGANLPNPNHVGNIKLSNRKKIKIDPDESGTLRGPRKKPGRTYTWCKRDLQGCLPVNKGAAQVDVATRGEFRRLTNEYGLQYPDTSVNKKFLSRKDLHIQFKAMRSPQTISMTKKWAAKMKGKAAGGAVAAAATVGLYINDIISVFSTDSNNWEKAAAVTSPIPFVGCTTAYGADKSRENEADLVSELRAGACVATDALLFTPLAPVAAIMKAVMIFSGEEADLIAKHDQTIEDIRSARNTEWDAAYSNIVDYLVSRDFWASIQARYTHEISGAIYSMASQAGMLYAARLAAVDAALTYEDVQKIERDIDNQWLKVYQQVCNNITDIASSLESTLPDHVAKSVEEEQSRFTAQWNMNFLTSASNQWAKTEKPKLEKQGYRPDMLARQQAGFMKIPYEVYFQHVLDKPDMPVDSKDIRDLVKEAIKLLPRDQGLCTGPPPTLPEPPPPLEEPTFETKTVISICGDDKKNSCPLVIAQPKQCTKVNFHGNLIELHATGRECKFYTNDVCEGESLFVDSFKDDVEKIDGGKWKKLSSVSCHKKQ